ncbi:hypothetical protein [Exiguobacterium sp. TNDT2]|uniref:hypothetical protein n=1 Tax=Exiguobacterium sp. TNDT2 TaxID=2233531 RepID=UPI000DEF9FA1|nr:hypothetical protein [Exiguobacterium sp. TNDT2]
MKQALQNHPSLWLWFILSFGLGLFGIYLAFTDSVYTMTAVIASLFAFGFALQQTSKRMDN